MLSTPAMQMAAKWSQLLGGMDRIQNRVVGGIQRGWKKVGDIMRTAGGSINDLKSKLDSLRKYRDGLDINLDYSSIQRANREIESLERKMNRLQGQKGGGGFGRKAAGFVGAMGGGLPGMLLAGGVYGAAAYGIGQAGQAVAQSTVAPAMQREGVRFQLNEITNNPAFVRQLESRLLNYAPEKMGEMLSASQKLVGAGVSQSAVFDTLKMLNNLSAVSNVKVDELSFILSKIKATGRVQGDEMDMLNERGINLSSQIAKVMGISESQVRKAQENGLITYDKFTKALEMYVGPGSRLANVAERKRDSTSQGRHDYLMGQFNERLTKLGERALPMVNKALEYTFLFLDRIAPLGEPILRFAGAFSPLFSSIGSLLQALGILDEKNVISAKWVTLLSNAMDILGKVVYGVSWVIGKVVDVISWIIEQFTGSGLMKLIGGYLGELGKRQEFKEGMAARRADRNSRLDADNRPLQGDKKGGTGTPSLGQAAGLDATVSGAAKKTVIVNIQNLINHYEPKVHASIHESAEDMHNMVIDALHRAVYSATATMNA